MKTHFNSDLNRSYGQKVTSTGPRLQPVEDLEELRELNQAIERNGSKPLIPSSKARKELGLS